MAPVDFEHEPEYDALCERLIDKTRQRKILWQETADPDAFIAAVKGVQSFEIRRACVAQPGPSDNVADFCSDVPELHVYAIIVKDKDGKQILSHTSPGRLAGTLFDLARRVGARVDERIESSLQLLDTL